MTSNGVEDGIHFLNNERVGGKLKTRTTRVTEAKFNFGRPREAYVERLVLYFQVNDIADDKRLPAFLSIIGSQTYSVLKSLVSPTQC